MSKVRVGGPGFMIIIGSLIFTCLILTTGAQPEEEEGPNYLAINRFQEYTIERNYNNELETVYLRENADTPNLRQQLGSFEANTVWENVAINRRPSFQDLEELSHFHIETATRDRYSKKETDVRGLKGEEEHVLLPHAFNGQRAEATIAVDVDGKMYFVTPFTLTPNGYSEAIYIERDGFGNEYVEYPYRRQINGKPDELCRVQLWVKGTDRFHARELKQYMYEKHGYYLIDPKNTVPNWMISRHNKPPANIYAIGSVIEQLDEPDSFKLSLSWVPSLCHEFIEKRIWTRREKCKQGMWAIHGLWDYNPYVYRDQRSSFCHWAIQEGQFALVQLPLTLERKLKKVMISLGATTSLEKFWTYEYCVHGTRMFKTPEKYFKTILLFYNTFREKVLTEKLKNLATHTNIWKLQEFLNAVYVGTRGIPVSVRCFHPSSVYAVVAEMRICFSLSRGIIQCNVYENETCIWHQKHRTQGIIHQPNYELYPYLVLTLAWKPSQMRRFMQNKYFEPMGDVHTRWIIHKLCPTFLFNVAMYDYKHDRHPINTITRPLLLSAGQIFNRIREMWPALIRGEVVYYEKIWVNCGNYLTTLRRKEFSNVLKYLETTVTMANRLHISNWNIPQDTDMDAITLHRRIAQSVGPENAVIHAPGSLILMCTKGKNPQTGEQEQRLLKIRACYLPDLTLIACPPSEIHHISSLHRKTSDQVMCYGRFRIPRVP